MGDGPRHQQWQLLGASPPRATQVLANKTPGLEAKTLGLNQMSLEPEVKAQGRIFLQAWTLPLTRALGLLQVPTLMQVQWAHEVRQLECSVQKRREARRHSSDHILCLEVTGL